MQYGFNDTLPLSLYRKMMADKYKRGEIIPAWKMPIYYDYVKDTYFCTLIGFHIIFRIIYLLWVLNKIIFWDITAYLQKQLNMRKDGL